MALEFLKNILNAELFSQLETALNAHNGNEANKDAQIKLANLAGGDYVSKLKYDDLMQQLTGKQTELDSANGLIADFKKNAKGNDELQGKITTYETQVADLQAQLAKTKLESEIKVALLGEKATDIDYLSFKLKEGGEKLEFGEDGKIKGMDDKIKGLKTQFPQFFEAPKGGSKVDPLRLQKGDDRTTEPQSLADALKQKYEPTSN